MEQITEIPSGLNTRQKVTLSLLSQGKTISQVSRQTGVSRNTLYRWSKDPLYQKALDSIQTNALQDHSKNGEDALFQAAESTPLLTLHGIRIRLQLLDMLILNDLRDHQDKRTRLIARLESSINQAEEFVKSLRSDEIASELLNQFMQKYQESVLREVLILLENLPGSPDLIHQFQQRLDTVDKEINHVATKHFKQQADSSANTG